MKPILELYDIGKKYQISHIQGGYLSLRERILKAFEFGKEGKEDFWALRDISFSVNSGDSLAIIGRNGAGKSTLLKILSRITPPTEGKIIARGRVASLLEVGTGFHPELSGRENVFFNGSLLGMKRKEIESRFDEIVDFSGMEKFLDTPLKHYSSGMQLRLAFSVAAFLEPEILIIDEVLAVGDAEFQRKCLGKMEDVSKSGRTILFVSHNMAAVENLCRQALLLDQGKILAMGVVEDIIQSYQASFSTTGKNIWAAPASEKETEISIRSASLQLFGVQPQHKLSVITEVMSSGRHKDAFVAFDISNSMGITVCQAIPQLKPFLSCQERPQTFHVEIDLPPLIPDDYKVSIWLGSHNTETLCWEKEILGFEITESPSEGRNYPHSHHNGFLVPQSRIVHG